MRKKVRSLKKTASAVEDMAKQESASKNPEERPSFGPEIDSFVLNVESLSRANHQTMKIVATSTKDMAKKFTALIEERGVVTKSEDGKSAYQIKPADAQLFTKRSKDLLSSYMAMKKIPEIFFCSLVHQYDAFLGRLLRVAFYVKPETLNASQRQITFSELMSYDSLDAAREQLVEKEIESIVRESHDDQFAWMENRFGLPLRKELPIWPVFIEMTERRNLFVHCDGVVSSQYLSVCGKHQVKLEDQLRAGYPLTVDRKYFDDAVDCVMEIGVKLAHVLWRKLQPDDLSQADRSLHRIAYDLLLAEKYGLAKTLLHFATHVLKKHSSDIIRRMNLVNLAIAHYYLGEKPEAIQLLDAHDWSACEDKFKLAVAVLRDDYQGAEKLMQKIGKKGEVSKEEYSSWPLFKTFRESKEFLRTYRRLFGKDFFLPKDEIQEKLEQSQQIAAPDRQDTAPASR
jgi:hypothetical protein